MVCGQLTVFDDHRERSVGYILKARVNVHIVNL